ncbi:MAG TPA: hypothetical protein VJP88_08935 [Caulobacteraceae bacterium]|nr:hypothetical protein [Caulobacteraceae bacterium]
MTVSSQGVNFRARFGDKLRRIGDEAGRTINHQIAFMVITNID